MTTKSCFVPTPDLNQYSYYFILLRLVQHRISCIFEGKVFSDGRVNLIRAFLPHPPEIKDQELRAQYVENETRSILSKFSELEQSPGYSEAMLSLSHYKGCKYEIASATMAGVSVLIYQPEPAQ